MNSNPLANFLYEKSLYHSIYHKHFDTAESFIERILKNNIATAVCQIQNSEGKTILHLLVDPNLSTTERGRANSILEKLISSKPTLITHEDIEIADKCGDTMLLLAAKFNNGPILKLFIENNLYTVSEGLRILPFLDSSELHTLAKKIKTTLYKNTKTESPKEITFEKLTQLVCSKNAEDYNHLKQFLTQKDEMSFDINTKNSQGYSLVLIAAQNENLAAVKLLLENGAITDISIEEKGKKGREIYLEISTKVFNYEQSGIETAEFKKLKELRDLLKEKRNKNTIKNKYAKEEEKHQKKRQDNIVAEKDEVTNIQQFSLP